MITHSTLILCLYVRTYQHNQTPFSLQKITRKLFSKRVKKLEINKNFVVK